MSASTRNVGAPAEWRSFGALACVPAIGLWANSQDAPENDKLSIQLRRSWI